MGISLKKGQKVDLTKGNEGLTQILVGLGWDKQKMGFSLFGGTNIDCDASVLLLNEKGKLSNHDDVVYFSALTHSSGSVVHMGDNLTGAGDGDDENITIYLNRVPSNIHKITFIVNIYDCQKRKQHFGMIKNAYIRLKDGSKGTELMRYNLSDDYSGSTALFVGEVYRDGSEWKFSAIGEGTQDKSLRDILDRL